MLKQRVYTALVLAFVFLGMLFFASPTIFSIFIAGIFCIAAWEWGNLSGIKKPVLSGLYAFGVLVLAITLSNVNPFPIDLPIQSVLYVACCWWAIALLWVQSYPASAVLWGPTWVRAVMGLFILVPTGLSLVYLYDSNSGAVLVLTLFLVVAAADIGAYFFGRAFGRRKLAKSVSPGKSWEGVFGGMFVASLIALVYVLVSGTDDYLSPFIIVVPTAMVSVLGDLVESMVKRHQGVKDSSQLLPGHGGFMDRIDGLTAAAPVFTLAIISTGWSF